MDSDRTKLRYPWGVLRDMTLERIPSLPEPSGIDGEVGRYLRRLHASLQEHLAMRPLDFQNLVDGFSYASTTHATTHSSGGDDEVSHDDLADFVANEHLLPAAIDHDALLNFVANEHLPGIDEDLMTSDSAVHVPTQQSVKAYVDTEITSAVGGIMNFNWTDEDSGSHTGDTDWQVVVNETSGAGRAQVLWTGSSVLTCEMRVTRDGGAAVTELPLVSTTIGHEYLIFDYSSALKIEFRVSNSGATVNWKVWWNNA